MRLNMKLYIKKGNLPKTLSTFRAKSEDTHYVFFDHITPSRLNPFGVFVNADVAFHFGVNIVIFEGGGRPRPLLRPRALRRHRRRRRRPPGLRLRRRARHHAGLQADRHPPHPRHLPVDHLVTPRILACVLALPFLTILCFTVGMASSALLADAVYGVSVNIILESARKALRPWDVLSAMLKSQVFGGIIAVVSCAWGVTTLGGAKGVGESTTSPVVTAVVVAGRLSSGFAAELGTMQVSEQTDTLRILGASPVDHLVAPRVLALPFLTLLCFTVGMASSALLADAVYGVSVNIILESARKALRPWDVLSAMLKSQVFGGIIAVVSCAWRVTTLGGAKGVGESTSAVVISLVGIFVADFVLSCFFFQGAGDSLKHAMG